MSADRSDLTGPREFKFYSYSQGPDGTTLVHIRYSDHDNTANATELLEYKLRVPTASQSEMERTAMLALRAVLDELISLKG